MTFLIAKYATYCTGLVQRPAETTLVLISDLYEGGDAPAMLRRAAGLVAAGVNLICLLALTDTGTPGYDHNHAAKLVSCQASSSYNVNEGAMRS